jgi:probable HAF family extracellular repeat protein
MNTARSLLIIASLLCASSLPAQAAPATHGYRLVPIGPSRDISITDLNRRGEVIGWQTVGGERHAFRWRAGTFTDLHGTVDPATSSSGTEAVGINDHSTIVGIKYTDDSSQGFVLRGTEVTPLQVAGGDQVFPIDINNRGQIIVDSYGGTQSGSFLVDGDHVQHLEGLPDGNGSMWAFALNDRGAVVGGAQSAEGVRAVLWQGGTVRNLGVPPGGETSVANALNNRLEIVGLTNIDGIGHAFYWRNGTMTLLPHLPQSIASIANAINNWGAIVGGESMLEPVERNTATLWFESRVVELDSIVCPKDPLKPYVHLDTAYQINDRGDIVAVGVDSRQPDERTHYFLTLRGQ